MSRDPFDEMKRQNPVTRDQLPSAAMSVADRILARRARVAWPGWAVAAAAAASVAVVGFGMLWFFNDRPATGVADGDTTTSIASTTVADTSTTMVDLEIPGTVYFFMDTIGESWSGGPFLVPVGRVVHGPDEITGTLQVLLDGTTVDEVASVPAISSTVPVGTVIREVSVAGGIVTVDLSSEFTSGGGSLSMMGRLAQVVYTLTRLDGIDGVRFEIEGVPTTVFGGEGVTVRDPATRADFASDESGNSALLPAILIESPSYLDFNTANPLTASGTANVFEATVSIELLDASGAVLFEGFTTATCGTGCRGDWEISIPYEVDALQLGSLIVYESSARDGARTNVRQHPLWLIPADSGTTTTVTMPVGCSGSNANPMLVEPAAGLPAEVAAKREAIFEAARACDWETLRSLLGEGFSYTFGIDDDPIAYWQELEVSGYEPMYYLAELLNRPFGILEYDKDLTYFVWPSAFNQNGWQDVPDADIEALRPLYDDEDFAGFAEFGGYIGYRVGILESGTWVFFLAGD